MERRGYGLGCIVTGLGVILSACLLPYLISSVYAVASLLLQVPTPTQWLWGDWLSGIIEPTSTAYRILVELPVCCAGALALLIVTLGVVWIVSGREREQELEVRAEVEAYLEPEGQGPAEPPVPAEDEPPN